MKRVPTGQALVGMLLAIVLGTLGALSPLARAADLGLELSPPSADLVVDPGEETVIPIAVANHNDVASVTVRVFLSPIVQSRDGGYRLQPQGAEPPWSALPWLELKERKLTVAPAREASVEVKVRLPRNASGSRAAAVVFEVVPDAGAGRGGETYSGTTTFTHRLTTIVKLTANSRSNRKEASASGLALASAATDNRFAKFGQNALAIICTVVNEGNTLIAGQGHLIIRNTAGRRVKEGPLGSGRGIVLPTATVDFVSVFPAGLPDGDYTAEATIHYGGSRPLQARMPFTVAGEGARGGKAQVAPTVNLSVYPEQVTAQLPAGAFRSIPFSLFNRDKIPIRVRPVVQGLASTQEGHLVPTEKTSGPWSATPWITFGQASVLVQPGERKALEVLVSVPKGTTDGVRVAALVFEAAREGNGQTGATTTISTPVLITSGRHLVRKGELTEAGLALPDDENGATLIGAVLANQGNTTLQPTGRVLLRRRGLKPTIPGELERLNDATFEDLGTLPLEGLTGPILPGETRTIVALHGKPWKPGEYQAEIIVDIGDKAPLRSTVTFVAAPEGVRPKSLP